MENQDTPASEPFEDIEIKHRSLHTKLKQHLKKLMLDIARSDISSHFIGYIFEHFSNVLPVKSLVQNKYIVAFEHPYPFWDKHFLIVPKKKIASFQTLDFNDSTQQTIFVHIFIAAQQLVSQLQLRSPLSLSVNNGKYQDVGQMHFHLASGDIKTHGSTSNEEYQPVGGEPLYFDNICSVSSNLKPQREIDFIVSIKNSSQVASFSDFDFVKNEDVITHTLKAVQSFLNQIEVETFTLALNESDINNSKVLLLRILSGKKV